MPGSKGIPGLKGMKGEGVSDCLCLFYYIQYFKTIVFVFLHGVFQNRISC